MYMETLAPQPSEVINNKVLLLVSASTSVSALAGSISGFCRSGVEVRLRSMGAGALSQAIKAVAVARKMMTNPAYGITKDLSLIPMFETVTIEGQARSAMTLVVLAA